jgi:hypothetical protein
MPRDQRACETDPSHNIFYSFHYMFPSHSSAYLSTFLPRPVGPFPTSESISSTGPGLMQIVPLYFGVGSHGSLYLDLAGRTSLASRVTNREITYDVHLLRYDLTAIIPLAWLLLNFLKRLLGMMRGMYTSCDPSLRIRQSTFLSLSGVWCRFFWPLFCVSRKDGTSH